MTYNNNIILNILQSSFWEEIEIHVDDGILNMDDRSLDEVFEYPVDYAEFASISEMSVNSYDVEKEPGEYGEWISGIMEVEVCVDGYAHWDGEDIVVDSGELRMEIQFSFYAEDDQYYDLDLENIL